MIDACDRLQKKIEETQETQGISYAECNFKVVAQHKINSALNQLDEIDQWIEINDDYGEEVSPSYYELDVLDEKLEEICFLLERDIEQDIDLWG